MPQSEYMLNGASDKSKVAIKKRLIRPVRGLNNTVQATDSITGGNIFGTMAAISKTLRKGALVRIEIQARVAANAVATTADPPAKIKELNNS